MVWGAVIGGATSILGGILGQSSQNSAAKRAESLRYKADLQNYDYQSESQRRAYKYAKEGLAIQRANNLANAAYNDATNMRNWQYQMGIRAFDYAIEQRAYNMRKQQASSQITFNNLSAQLAGVEIDNWKREQTLALDFEEKSTNLEFRYNQLGQVLDFQTADLARQQTRAGSQLEQQKNYVDSLKAKGQAQARGASGVTAEKVAGAAIAEAGLNAAAITQQVFNAEANFGLTSDQINLNLQRMNDQFYLDKSKLAASRVSLDRQAGVAKFTQMMKGMEANLNALYAIGFEPIMGPAPPKPLPTPIPQLQDPLKPLPLPKPIKGAAYTVNPMLAGLAGAGQSIGAFAQAAGTYFGRQGPGADPAPPSVPTLPSSGGTSIFSPEFNPTSFPPIPDF